MKDLPEVCEVMASELAREISAHGVEQVHYLLGNRYAQNGEQSRAVVLVAVSDRTADAVLEFLDQQVRDGIVSRRYTT
jgi:hypothetical protein